jgi:tripartite-type tricarboxylate transporter receptor subunit TctC
VNPAFPTNTLPEFIAYAKANPAKVSMATSGSGSPSDVYTALARLIKATVAHEPFSAELQNGYKRTIRSCRRPFATESGHPNTLITC